MASIDNYWPFLDRWLEDDDFAEKFGPDGVQLPEDDYLADDIATQWMFDNWDRFNFGNEVRQPGEAWW